MKRDDTQEEDLKQNDIVTKDKWFLFQTQYINGSDDTSC